MRLNYTILKKKELEKKEERTIKSYTEPDFLVIYGNTIKFSLLICKYLPGTLREGYGR